MTQTSTAWQMRLACWKQRSGSDVATRLVEVALGQSPHLVSTVDRAVLLQIDLEAREAAMTFPVTLVVDTGSGSRRILPNEFIAIEHDVDWVDGPQGTVALTPSGTFSKVAGEPCRSVVLVKTNHGDIGALPMHSAALERA